MAMIIIKNIRLHYREQGIPDQSTLLLIHGLGCSLKYWNSVFETAALSTYRIVSLDLPGFGMSEKPAWYDYALPSQAEIIFAFIQALKLQDIVLIGHSMGGAIATLLAYHHPQHVRQLIVIEPNLRASEARLSHKIIEHSESEFVEHYEAFKQSAITSVQGWFVNSHQSALDRYMGELLKTTPISIYRSARSIITVTSDDTLLKQFQQLKLRKHFLISEKTLKKRGMPECCRDGDIPVVIVPGVGHMMMVDNPVLFGNTLATVLQ